MPGDSDRRREGWEAFEAEATPAPVDPTAAYAWQVVRERVAKLTVIVEGLVVRVTDLEGKNSDMWRTLASLEKSSALQLQMLEHLVEARKDDITRTRALLGILIPIISIAVAVIAIVTR